MRSRVLVAAVAALAWAGCRSDEELAPPDLSAPSLYCPGEPPASGSFVCDPTSIPFCTYPLQQLTCACEQRGASAVYTLECGTEVQPDAGLPTGTGT
jgi:hypothetical protein